GAGRDAGGMGGGAVLDDGGGRATRGVAVDRSDRRGDRQAERALMQVGDEGIEERESSRDCEGLVRRVRHHLIAEALRLEDVAWRAADRVEAQLRLADPL